MESTRRDFLDSLLLSTVAGTAALSGFPAALAALTPTAPGTAVAAGPLEQGGWDTGWGARLTGRVKAVFDVAEVESGVPVWRASIWSAQYEQVLGMPARELSTALVLRHNAVVLAMRQSYWDRYGLGAAFGVRNPMTGEESAKNVALLGEADGVGAPYADFALDKFIGRGGVALACDLALRVLVMPRIQQADGLTAEQAYTTARAGLLPGVILQPSGMFAVLRAQEAGAFYFRAD